MSSDRERKILRICQAALERPPAERAAFVADACAGDAGVQTEVEGLLAHADGASSFLETPALAVAAQGLGEARQALVAGQQIGAYTILSPLGSGGMGEVFRARDTTLGREVAIKVLPAIFVADPDRFARFEREAHVLAALNHPNIATIHGLERVGDAHALILEVVEGETLAELIGGRPLPVDQALAIARQMTDALEAAHDKSIVHRDLKPANIKIRPDGVVKVLDFGLAKAIARDGEGHDVSHSPTVAVGHTRDGVLLGTAAYMSPEQARGKAVDKRADVWAFGCVLYEMLTGRAPFSGETSSDTIAAVLSREPDWTAVPAAVPANITRVLRRCLQKDPARRLRDVADARFELDEGPGEPADDVRATTRSRLRWTTLAVVVVAGLVGMTWWLRPQLAPGQMVRLEVNTPPTLDPLSLAISPDGRTLAFVATRDGQSQLWVRALDAASATPLAGTENAVSPFWSPNSQSIGFGVAGQLKRIDLESGSVRVVASFGNVMQGGAWNEAGTILFNPGTGSSLWRVSADGGEHEQATQLDQLNRYHRSPQFLPGGRRFLFHVTGPAAGIYVGQLESSDAPRRILDADFAVYVSTGHLFFVRDRTLLAQPFDAARAQLTGSPTVVADNVIVGAPGAAALSASAAGPIVFRTGSGAPTQFVWFDRTGKATETVRGSDIGSSFRSALSRDEKQLAFGRTVRGTGDIWLLDLLRGVPSSFTTDPGFELSPVWSPDGSRIAFYRESEARFDLVVRPVGRTGSDEVLFSVESQPDVAGDKDSCWPNDWSRDGELILCERYYTGKRGADLTAIPVTGGHKPIPITQTPFSEGSGQFSPDDRRWVAYQADESGGQEIYIQSLRGQRKLQVSRGGGTQARWRQDGGELYYLTPDHQLMAVPIRLGPGPDDVHLGAAVSLFQTHLAGNTVNGRHYHVSSDGQRFLIDTVKEITSPITVLLNWKHGP